VGPEESCKLGWYRRETKFKIRQRQDNTMTSLDPMSLFLSLQREMAEMKRKNEEEIRTLRQKKEEEIRTLQQMNEKELRALRKENSDMKKIYKGSSTP